MILAKEKPYILKTSVTPGGWSVCRELRFVETTEKHHKFILADRPYSVINFAVENFPRHSWETFPGLVMTEEILETEC